ncbi:putative galactose oxidase-like [Capsicum annuum]|nr:putative galactose oxidase-like [Capsicum annuum]
MEHLLFLIVLLISMVYLNSISFSINENLYFKVNKTAIAQTRKAFMDFDISNLQDPPMPPNSASQCEPCSPKRCYKQAFNAIYNYTESSTYKKLDCVTESGCLNSVFQCNVDLRLCFYSQKYGNGEKTIGFLATDIITFVGDNTQARIIFGCSVDQMSGTSQFVNTYSGIISLGKTPGIYSLPSQLGSNLFALCLPSVEAATGSFLTFNKAPWVYGIEAKLLKNRQQPHLYYVNLYKIFINDREVPVDPTWWNGQKEDHGAFVDTGTLISRFPHDYYIIFRYTFREQVHYPLYQRGVFDTCYKEIEGEEEMQFPSVRLFFGNLSVTQELKLEQDRVVKNINGYYCLAFLPWDLKLTLIGTHQLQGTGLTFDMKNNVLTFSVDACD